MTVPVSETELADLAELIGAAGACARREGLHRWHTFELISGPWRALAEVLDRLDPGWRDAQ